MANALVMNSVDATATTRAGIANSQTVAVVNMALVSAAPVVNATVHAFACQATLVQNAHIQCATVYQPTILNAAVAEVVAQVLTHALAKRASTAETVKTMALHHHSTATEEHLMIHVFALVMAFAATVTRAVAFMALLVSNVNASTSQIQCAQAMKDALAPMAIRDI